MNDKKCIIIQYEYGSAGLEIAKQISAKLKIPFYDNDALTYEAEKRNIDLSDINEIKRNISGSVLHDVAFFSEYMDKNRNAGKTPFLQRNNLIKELASEGPCIFLGGCYDKILSDEIPYFHVLIYSTDMNNKIEYIRDSKNTDDIVNIEEHINKKNQAKKKMRSFITKKNLMDLNEYDLCINTSSIDCEKAAEAIIAAFKT